MSINGAQIRQKILDLYPEISRFNVDIVTDFSEEKNSWIVTLVKDGHTLFTHIESEDAQKCLENSRCVYFSNQLMGFLDAYCSSGTACHV